MKVLVELPINEFNGFIEQIKNKSYHIIDDSGCVFF